MAQKYETFDSHYWTEEEEEGEIIEHQPPPAKHKKVSKSEVLVFGASSKTTLPTRSTAGSAGYDICTPNRVIVHPGKKITLHTGIQLAFPRKKYATIHPRSGLAFNNDIWVVPGLIDNDFTGEIKVRVANLSETTSYEFLPGEKIAQIVFHKMVTPQIVWVKTKKLNSNEQHKGFGSSGRFLTN